MPEQKPTPLIDIYLPEDELDNFETTGIADDGTSETGWDIGSLRIAIANHAAKQIVKLVEGYYTYSDGFYHFNVAHDDWQALKALVGGKK